MKYFIPKYLFPLFVLLMAINPDPIAAQEVNNNKVTISVLTTSDTLVAGDKIGFKVSMDIERGWHINSNQPEEDFLIPTKLVITSPSKIDTANIVYPSPVKIKTEFNSTPLSVFTDGNNITGTLTALPDNSSNEITINFELQYQACNNQTCSAPETSCCKKVFAFIKK